MRAKEEIPLDENGEYYYKLFKSIGAQYVYDSPYTKEYKEIFCAIENDEKRFELIFNSNGHRIWRIKYDK